MHMNNLFFFTPDQKPLRKLLLEYNDGRYTRGPAPRQPGNRFRFVPVVSRGKACM